MTEIRTYQELLKFSTFEDRYYYLRLGGYVGRDTFGYDRYLNQAFYRSRQWKSVREYVLARDYGCDLAIDDRPIFDRPLVHHMNPIQIRDLEHGLNEDIINPDFLITVSHDTHNAIHYGSISNLVLEVPERKPYDTVPWKTS